MLMLSGVPSLGGYIREEEQLFELLDPISFDPIALGTKSDPHKDPDMLELNKLVFAYADHAAVDFEDLADFDFLERLDFACASRWGLVIELLIAALVFFKNLETGNARQNTSIKSMLKGQVCPLDFPLL